MMLLNNATLPEAVFRSDWRDVDRRPRFVTPVYGPLTTSFSGTSWFLTKSGILSGQIEGGFTLYSRSNYNPRVKAAGAFWNGWRLLRRRNLRGFKFSELFSNILWDKYINRLSGSTIINNFQIYGSQFERRFQRLDIKPCFYIDGTLTEYFHGYGQVEYLAIGKDVVAEAIAIERSGYQCAERIITMSALTARHLVSEYGVDASRISTVVPGANLPDDLPFLDVANPPRINDEFTIGFVGLFPQRKGLATIAGAVALLRARKVPVRLRVIGRCPPEIAAMDGVDDLGIINKATDLDRFVAAIGSVDLGCQLSRAELLGIAVLEFIKLGVPVLATRVGGVPDVLAGGGGLLVSPDISIEDLADKLQNLVSDSQEYRRLQAAAVARSGWASWRRACGEIDGELRSIA